MNEVKKPEIDIEKLGVNPFLSNLVIPVSAVTMAGQWKRDKDGIMLPVEVDLDRDDMCRVYVGSGRRKQMAGLSARAKDLLLWVIYETETGCDYLWVNYRRYMKENGVKSYNTYITAVRELVGHSFIQLTIVQHVYWINPHLFFNGSRINKFPDKVVRK